MMKRIISFICVVAMLTSMCAVSAGALTIDYTLTTKWNAMGIKYSVRTKAPIIDSYTNTYKNVSFEFNETDDGGIDMGVPTYNEFPGVYGASVITSKYKTELADLCVEIDPDDFDFQQDTLNIANHIGILWSEDPVKDVNGLSTADTTAFSGLRHLIPSNMNDYGFEIGIPTAEAKADEITGKALYVGITNANPANAGTKTASNVNIVYFDGHYVNKNDGSPGYSWTFTSRNGEGPLGDATPICTNYERLDISGGLKITIKEDTELGYIVNINGKDYYEGRKIAYFPDADKNGKSHVSISTHDIVYETDVYTTSMTFAREDIDLSGLKEANTGYLTVGVTGINDSGMTHGTDIVIKKINTKTPSTWKGEPACYHTEKEWVVTKEPDCGYEGVDSYTCKACGKVFETKAIPTVGEHNPVGEWTVAVDPNCANEGKEVNLCTKCGLPAEEKVIPADPEKHSKGWYTTFPTCEEVGIKKRYCLICGIMFPEENLILDPIGHAFTNYIIDSNATCIEDGTKTAKCDRCDATDVITESAYGHIEGEWETVKQTSCTESGKKILKCKVCNIVLKTENIPNIASHSFTIYKYNNDATCLKDGTKTAYCDNGCGTTDTVTAAGTSTGKHNYKESVLTEATCENEGIMLYLCECGNNYTKSISKAHKEKWMVVVEPTATQEGKEIKYCTVCTVVLETKTLPKKNSTVFIDVPLNTWYAEGVSYCSEKGYITGIGNNKFNPNGKLTREQFVVILARVAGAELSDYKSTEFNDVDVNSWYGPSVIWANKEGYVNGVGDGTKFGVSQEMTREQLATMFYRYAEKNSVNVDAKANLTEFIDASSVSNWATDACAWAIGAGLLGSTDSSKKVLSPQMTVTRAQAAKIFMSYDNIK